jgi:pimeloyl-ACP methyl ester carboxylesterase
MKPVLRGAACLVLALIAAATVYGWHAIGQARVRQTGERVASAPAGGEFVDAGDASIFVQRLGQRDAPAVVFVHGTGSWSELWRPSMVTASQRGYQAIALDMPPFGYSVSPVTRDFSRPKQAARLLAALDSLGVQRAIFVAHSFGAAPLMEALLAQPQRVAGLVLVDAALGLDSPAGDGSDNLAQRLLRQRWFSRAVSAGFLTNPDHTGTLLRSFITEKDKATPQWIAVYQRPLALSESFESVAAWLPELLAERGTLRSDDRAAYAQLPYPVTLIWGEADTITPLAQAHNLQRYLGQARLRPIAKAGHIPQIEEEAQFQAALAAALPVLDTAGR